MKSAYNEQEGTHRHDAQPPPTIYPIGTRVTMRLPNIGAPHYGEVGVVIAVDEDTTTVRFEGGGSRNGGHGNEYAGEHRHWIAVEDHVAERQRSDHT